MNKSANRHSYVHSMTLDIETRTRGEASPVFCHFCASLRSASVTDAAALTSGPASAVGRYTVSTVERQGGGVLLFNLSAMTGRCVWPLARLVCTVGTCRSPEHNPRTSTGGRMAGQPSRGHVLSTPCTCPQDRSSPSFPPSIIPIN